MKPYILATSTWKTIRDQDFETAILPWGATEAHNLHLPYATDNIMTEKIAEASAAYAWDRGARAVVLPCVPFGVNTGQLDIKVNLNINPSTQMAIVADIADVLNRHGILKLVILNGHGGNDFKQIIRELGMRFPSMFICCCNWYQSFENNSYFEKGGGHADEMETSIMQYIAPELVLPLDEAGKGEGKKFRIQALNEKWAWAERRWSKVTSDTGIGDPSAASAEKGEKCFSDVVSKIGEFITGLCNTDINDMYK